MATSGNADSEIVAGVMRPLKKTLQRAGYVDILKKIVGRKWRDRQLSYVRPSGNDEGILGVTQASISLFGRGFSLFYLHNRIWLRQPTCIPSSPSSL